MSIKQEQQNFIFTFKGLPYRIVYQPHLGLLDELVIHPDGASAFCITSQGGPTSPGAKPLGLHGSPKLENDTLHCEFEWEKEGKRQFLTYAFTTTENGISIEINSPSAWAEGFKPGVATGAEGLSLSPVIIPAMDFAVGQARWNGGQLFFSCYFDESVSDASGMHCPYESKDGRLTIHQEAYYHTLSDGITRHALHERLLIQISPDVCQTFRKLPPWVKTSEYMDELSGLMPVDLWHGQDEKFDVDRLFIEKCHRFGMRKLLVIQHVWQRSGYDAGLPDTLPANKLMGGTAKLKKFLEVAKRHGSRVALHENMTDIYDTAPSYRKSDVSLNHDGTLQRAWVCSTNSTQGYCPRPSASLRSVEKWAPQVHALGTNAAFIDVITTNYYGGHQEFDVTVKGAGKFKLDEGNEENRLYSVLRAVKRMKEIHQGPFIGEGGHHLIYAGHCDAAEAENTRLFWTPREFVPPLLDFDLRNLHPLMVNHGVGYLGRFFAAPPPYTMAHYEKSRIQALAYGHAGWISTLTALPWLEAFREYYALLPLQQRYSTSKVKIIAYWSQGKWCDVSAALSGEGPWKALVTYECGLKVWTNCHPTESWNIETPAGKKELPCNGWWAEGAGVRSGSILSNGIRIEFTEAPGINYACAAPGCEVEAEVDQFIVNGTAVIREDKEGWTSLHGVRAVSMKRKAASELPIFKASARCDLSATADSKELVISVSDVHFEAGVTINLGELPAFMKEARMRKAPLKVRQFLTRGGKTPVTLMPKWMENGSLSLANCLESNIYHISIG